MWRKSCLIFILLISICIAQEIPENPQTKRTITLGNNAYVIETEPTTIPPLNKHVLFVFDCSGSMNPGKIREAMGFLTGIASQPIDQMEFGVLAFDAPTHGASGLYRWPGIPEPDAPKPVPPGWAALPSKDAIDEAVAWITITRNERGGSTRVIPALRNALAEERADMSIILITDGDFNDNSGEIVMTIITSMATRRAKKLAAVPIMVFGVTWTISNNDNRIMQRIATLGTGGYFLEQEPPEEYEDVPTKIYGPPGLNVPDDN